MKRIISIFIFIMLFMISSCSVDEDEDNRQVYQEPIVIGYSIRTLSNPYYPNAVKGIEIFIKQQDRFFDLYAMEHFSLDSKQIQDIREIIAKGGDNVILIVDPNRVDNVYEISEICEEENVYWSTIWTRPDDLHPRDLEHYVSHQEVDNVLAGYTIAKTMFESFSGKDKYRVAALAGDDLNDASNDRVEGLLKAIDEYEQVELIDIKTVDWSAQLSYTQTVKWINEYEHLDGIWAANDIMAMAVADALEINELNQGKVKVVGVDGIAIDYIKKGDILATYSANPWVQASYATAITYGVFSGQIDKNEMTEEQMVFFTDGELVTASNVDAFERKWMLAEPKLDFSDPFIVISSRKDE